MYAWLLCIYIYVLFHETKEENKKPRVLTPTAMKIKATGSQRLIYSQ